MLIKKAADIRESEVTPKELFLRRREFIAAAGMTAFAVGSALAQNPSAQKIPNLKKGPFNTDEKLNSYKDITTYNNFYEFGTDKDEPARNAGSLKPRPWTLAIEGLVKTPGNYDIDAFIKPYALEDRIYRLRCVEAWSMVIPWIGIPLADVIKRIEPAPSAKFV